MQAAIDIGYSNLKLASFTNGKLRTQILPAGAAPMSRLSNSVNGNPDRGLSVMVDDTPYAAGLSPVEFQQWNRSLHEDYPSTPSYRALFHAGLLSMGATYIDYLVTGLPVSQYNDETRRQALVDQLTGVHQVTPTQRITIDRVKVMAQPAGAYMDLLFASEDSALLTDSRVLVIDPGFFSVDWVVIENNNLHQALSGTSTMATSMILEAVQPLIFQDHKGKVSLAKLEQAVRLGKQQIVVNGKQVALQPYLDDAVATIVPVAMDALQQSIRSGDDGIDFVLIVGGAAALYESHIREAFPYSRIVLPADPALANVRGFGLLAGHG